ncbi:hypothetical protein V5O48_014720 [Marasmius crinis-equi]|uniref:Prolyl 4-hydroxylase alpha subunit domain-containing protein n=1 Tax=Marasmius crinis-equi TaxID=585013 RepID=A0ABR3EWV1_9AGAR
MYPTIDFASTPLAPCYAGFYAKVLDDVFTPAECAELITLAASQAGGWQPAGLSTREEKQTVHRDFRNSERTLVIDEIVSKRIYDRLRPLVEEIAVIAPKGPWAGITGKIGRKQGPTWELDTDRAFPLLLLDCSSVNPRLSFLRYGPGHYFKPHCDGLNELKDGLLKSFVTLHLYLTDDTTVSKDGKFFTCHSEEESDNAEVVDTPYDSTASPANESGSAHAPSIGGSHESRQSLTGGATRFWSPNKKDFLDVEPKIGRVLVFQQRMLIHSGEEVTSGMKYTMRGDFMFREIRQ